MFYFESVHKIQVNQVKQSDNVHSQDQTNFVRFFCNLAKKQWH